MSETTLEQVIDNACRDLPKGYVIRLGMENGAAWVELRRTKGFEVWNIDGGGEGLVAEIAEAVETAIKYDKEM